MRFDVTGAKFLLGVIYLVRTQNFQKNTILTFSIIIIFVKLAVLFFRIIRMIFYNTQTASKAVFLRKSEKVGNILSKCFA